MPLRELLSNSTVLLDGGFATLLQQRGLAPGELPERWNLTHPGEVKAVHRAYFDAGANIVMTDTFGANPLKFGHDELESIIRAAVGNARAAAAESSAPQEKFVALDVGPTGRLLAPLGELAFGDAVDLYAQTVRLGVRYGVDLIMIETLGDSLETKAALLAAKENSDLPVFVCNAYGADGKLLTGASPEAMAALLEGMGADAIGVNCSLGPDALMPAVERLLKVCSVPVIMKPNAGLPRDEDGRTVYDVAPAEFALSLAKAVRAGVRIVGGCCGTTPEHIKAAGEAIKDVPPVPVTKKDICVVSSYTHAVDLGDRPVVIGERINPTGKKKLRAALTSGDLSYPLTLAVSQQDAGAQVLDVNVGCPGVDEPALLEDLIKELQAVTDLPLQPDSSDPEAMERALRCYNGKALVNSVNAKEESMAAIFPLIKKYGGVAVALTLDEDGIPGTAAGRVELAHRILARAADYGRGKNDLIFDPLAMTVASDDNSARVALDVIAALRAEGLRTVLGASNFSFGLPNRPAVTAAALTRALDAGLDAAIIDPTSYEVMRSVKLWRMLEGLDRGCADYLAWNEDNAPPEAAAPDAKNGTAPDSEGLKGAVARGLAEDAAKLTKKLLADGTAPLDIVAGELIPALDAVGRGYERGEIYLPQLLMGASAAKAAFDEIKAVLPAAGTDESRTVVIATVKGDIHDIGKNIVKLLLENYGFNAVDLGRDVPAEKIVEAVERSGAKAVGLSALMTTTVPAMEETVALLRKRVPGCKAIVGGAVLNADYAAKIGADFYAADAMETVRIVEKIYS